MHGIEENHQIFVTKSCVRCEIQIMKSILQNERNRTLLSGYSNENVAVYEYDEFPYLIMDAHETGVGNVLISKENSAIFSKATDKKIKIWSLNN